MIEGLFLADFFDFSLKRSAFQRTMAFHIGFCIVVIIVPCWCMSTAFCASECSLALGVYHQCLTCV
jgi:hypothetical protein